jgi:hypothetical protein
MHEIEAKALVVMQDIAAKRKRGRPSINQQPMTPAERQVRRRASQSEQPAIRETLQIGDATGKDHAEAESGGYDSLKLDTLEASVDDDGIDRGRWRHVPAVKSGTADDLQIGDEEANRRRFAGSELRKMVGEYLTSPEKSPSASWVAKHSGNNSVQHHVPPAITLTCKLCADSMESIEDAQDHLRVDHRTTIDEWFRNLEPRREFRDMGDYVTIVMPRKYTKP